ncbi:ABC transporter substrate-binding protein [Ruminococcaceae bacterium OttesenSCG-928-I18]|nr:ABC transporter substrate-binding protein [Ruminococcaceae bacterium OttesenSCG-928-I18]
MKKLAIFVSLIMMLTLALAGCGGGTDSAAPADGSGDAAATGTSGAGAAAADTGDAVNINLWAGFTGDDAKAMEGMVANFNEEHPDINVTFYTAPWSDMFTKFAASYGTDAGPDAIIMHATDIPNFASREMIAPLDDLTEQLGVSADDYSENIWTGNGYEGVQYGIPLDYHPMAVFKNVELFEAAGLDPEMTFETKEDFLAAAEALTNENQHGIALGAEHAHSMRYWYGLLYQAGGEFLTEDMSASAFNSPEGTEALTFLSDLIFTQKVAPELEADIDRDWLSGNVAMVIEGPWFVPTAVDSGFEFTTAPFPQIFDEAAVWAGSHTLTLPAQSNGEDREAAAITLVSWIAENSVQWGISSGQIPASYTVQQSEEYTSMDNYKYVKAFIDQAEIVHYEPLIPKTAEIGADNQLSPILNGIFSALRGDQTPQEALDTAAGEVDSILQS